MMCDDRYMIVRFGGVTCSKRDGLTGKHLGFVGVVPDVVRLERAWVERERG